MNYDRMWTNLNSELGRLETASGELSLALEGLELQQRNAGFIKDDLKEVRRLSFESEDSADLSFRAQLNPRRADRHGGAGISSPPVGQRNINDGCFLCRENIRWQQDQCQIGFEILTENDSYNVLMNPFPLLPNHVVVASHKHVPQAFRLPDEQGDRVTIDHIVKDLCEIAKRLPDHIGFYNGVDAGASIPGHLHYQFFRRAPDDPIFPLELRHFAEFGGAGGPELIQDYPIDVLRWSGEISAVVLQFGEWITNWLRDNEFRKELMTCNLICSSAGRAEEVVFYFVPRLRDRQFWRGDGGIVGGLEILGELVLATKEELRLIDSGNIDYNYIFESLSMVNAPLSQA